MSADTQRSQSSCVNCGGDGCEMCNGVGHVGRLRYLAQRWHFRGWRLRVLWEPRDLWIGVYWDPPDYTLVEWTWKVYVCIVPCLPILWTHSRIALARDFERRAEAHS